MWRWAGGGDNAPGGRPGGRHKGADSTSLHTGFPRREGLASGLSATSMGLWGRAFFAGNNTAAYADAWFKKHLISALVIITKCSDQQNSARAHLKSPADRALQHRCAPAP